MGTIKTMDIIGFVEESNLIEGITRPPNSDEIDATLDFIELEEIRIEDVSNLVNIFQPGAKLRSEPGMNVMVGNYRPPAGGPQIPEQLELLLKVVNTNHQHAWKTHVRYEDLHPYMDGNGRSGRSIWLWQMCRFEHEPTLGFLHQFYYQTLSRVR